jgi:hypothetical protein
MVATLPALFIATHTQKRTCIDVILQHTNVTSATKMIQLVAILTKLRPVKIVKPLQRVNGNATELCQKCQNAKSAKETPQQTARAELKLVRHVLHHKSFSSATRS